jgi:hypothetical protein
LPLLISEIFGRSVHDLSSEAKEIRNKKHCPFRNAPCTKTSKSNPLGVCTIASDTQASAVCPVRFLENNTIFRAAASIAFGSEKDFAIFPEFHLLKIKSKNGKEKKIGKVDFLIGKILNGEIVDFAAVEVQATYFSGNSIRPAMEYFLETGQLNEAISDRRPDFRSSAQKRLIPQLQLKVPIFRRWGKRFFVVVDQQFFSAMPDIRPSSKGNSELTWLVFPMPLVGNRYILDNPVIYHTQWDDVVSALREGTAPEASEIMAELQSKLDSERLVSSKIAKS